MITEKITLKNRLGIHARPASVIVKTVNQYQSKVSIGTESRMADAKSILGVLSTGLKLGDEMTITADGPDEELCIAQLLEVVEQKFFEE